MPRKNCNARPRVGEMRPNPNIRPPRYDVVSEGYRPIGPRLDVINPPQGGSGLKTTAESIVREFRIADRGARIEIPISKEPISIFERAVRIFLLIVTGWLFGYFHCWMAFK